METIGLFGGTFDPVHIGHLRAAAEDRRQAGLDRVLFIPSYLPPHKAPGAVASAADRLRMVELACRRRAGFEASAIEVEAGEKSYSIQTLRKVRALHPAARLFFILRVDAFLEIGTWREYRRVLGECLFIVIGRPGFELERARDVLGGSPRRPRGRRARGLDRGGRGARARLGHRGVRRLLHSQGVRNDGRAVRRHASGAGAVPRLLPFLHRGRVVVLRAAPSSDTHGLTHGDPR